MELEFKNYWVANEPMFQAAISITADKDLTDGWEMQLTFNEPVTDLIVSYIGEGKEDSKELAASPTCWCAFKSNFF